MPQYYPNITNLDYCNVLALQLQALVAEAAQIYDSIVSCRIRIDPSLFKEYRYKTLEIQTLEAEYEHFMTSFLNGTRDPLAEFEDELDKNSLLRVI
jgi:hypothetical protein